MIINVPSYADTFFCVVDLHAITVPHEPKDLREASHATAAAYIAAGVDPSKSSIFMQSHVAGHSELTWLLGCYTPIGWLERMIQFKVCRQSYRHDVSDFASVCCKCVHHRSICCFGMCGMAAVICSRPHGLKQQVRPCPRRPCQDLWHAPHV